MLLRLTLPHNHIQHIYLSSPSLSISDIETNIRNCFETGSSNEECGECGLWLWLWDFDAFNGKSVTPKSNSWSHHGLKIVGVSCQVDPKWWPGDHKSQGSPVRDKLQVQKIENNNKQHYNYDWERPMVRLCRQNNFPPMIGILKYTIWSLVFEASCHLVTWSLCHLFTWSLGHLVTWSLSHSVTRSLSHLVTQSYCHYFQHDHWQTDEQH